MLNKKVIGSFEVEIVNRFLRFCFIFNSVNILNFSVKPSGATFFGMKKFEKLTKLKIKQIYVW